MTILYNGCNELENPIGIETWNPRPKISSNFRVATNLKTR